MKEAITGSIIPMKNQSQGLLPIRLAKRAVIIGTLKKISIPIKIINSPIYILFVSRGLQLPKFSMALSLLAVRLLPDTCVCALPIYFAIIIFLTVNFSFPCSFK